MEEALKVWVSKALDEKITDLSVIKNANFMRKILLKLDEQYFEFKELNSIIDIMQAVDNYYTNELKINFSEKIKTQKKEKDTRSYWIIFLGISFRNKKSNEFLNLLVNNQLDPDTLKNLITFIKEIQQQLDQNKIEIVDNRQDQYAELFQQIEQLSKKNDQSQEKIYELKEKIQQLEEKQFELVERNNQLESKMEKLIAQKQEVLDSYKDVYQETSLVTIYKAMEKSNSDLSEILHQKQQLIQYYEQQLREIKEENTFLKFNSKNQIKQLERNYKDKLQEKDLWISDSRRKIEKLEQEIQELNESKASLNRIYSESLRSTVGGQRSYQYVEPIYSRNTIAIVQDNQFQSQKSIQVPRQSINFGNQINSNPNNLNNSARTIETPNETNELRMTKIYSSNRNIIPDNNASKLKLSKKLTLDRQLKPIFDEQNAFTRLKQRQSQIVKLQEQIKEKKILIQQKQSIIKERDVTIEQLNTKVNRCEKLIESLKKQIEEKQEIQITTHDEYETKFINMCDQIESLKQFFSQKEEEVTNLQKSNVENTRKLQKQYEIRIDTIMQSLEQQLLSFKRRQLDNLQEIRKLKIKIKTLTEEQQQKPQESEILKIKKIELTENNDQGAQSPVKKIYQDNNTESIIFEPVSNQKKDSPFAKKKFQQEQQQQQKNVINQEQKKQQPHKQIVLQNHAFEYKSQETQERIRLLQKSKQEIYELKQININLQNQFSSKKEEIITTYTSREQNYIQEISRLNQKNKYLQNQYINQKKKLIKHLEKDLLEMKSREPQYSEKFEELSKIYQEKKLQVEGLQLKQETILNLLKQINVYKQKELEHIKNLNELEKKTDQIEKKKIAARHELEIAALSQNTQKSQLFHLSSLNKLHQQLNQKNDEIKSLELTIQKNQATISNLHSQLKQLKNTKKLQQILLNARTIQRQKKQEEQKEDNKMKELEQNIKILKESLENKNKEVDNLLKLTNKTNEEVRLKYDHQIKSLMQKFQAEVSAFKNQQNKYEDQIARFNKKIEKLDKELKKQKEEIKLREEASDPIQSESTILQQQSGETISLTQPDIKSQQINLQKVFMEQKDLILSQMTNRQTKYLSEIEKLKSRNLGLQQQIVNLKTKYMGHLQKQVSFLKNQQTDRDLSLQRENSFLNGLNEESKLFRNNTPNLELTKIVSQTATFISNNNLESLEEQILYLKNKLSRYQQNEQQYKIKIKEFEKKIQQIIELRVKQAKVYEENRIKLEKKNKEEKYSIVKLVEIQFKNLQTNIKSEVCLTEILTNKNKLAQAAMDSRINDLQQSFRNQINFMKSQTQKEKNRLEELVHSKEEKISSQLGSIQQLKTQNFNLEQKLFNIQNQNTNLNLKVLQLNLQLQQLNYQIETFPQQSQQKNFQKKQNQFYSTKDLQIIKESQEELGFHQVKVSQQRLMKLKEDLKIYKDKDHRNAQIITQMKQQIQSKSKENERLLDTIKNYDALKNSKTDHKQYIQALKKTNEKLVEQLKTKGRLFELFKKKYAQMNQNYKNLKNENQLLISVLADLRVNLK